jgi:hypothetical protein
MATSNQCDTGYHARCRDKDCECSCHAKVKNAVELLLQVIELFPDAAEHVGQYVSHDELHGLQQLLKVRD